MNPDELLQRHKSVMPGWVSLYYERPLELVGGEGFRVWDSEGNEYLDFFGGIVTTISGHAVPEISGAVKEQADRIFHSSTLYLMENQVRLAERLVGLSPISGDQRVFFVGSGSEANEAVLLFAMAYRGSNEVVALRNSYHGGSLATMGVTGQSTWRPVSGSGMDVSYAINPHAGRCPFCKDKGDCTLACADDVRQVIETTTTGHPAAFIAEPIQGVGGFIEAPEGYFARVKEILDEYGILLVVDEVQTGFGRTGSHFWGIERHGVEPDLVVMAKGLGNGLAIGAVMGRAEVVDSISGSLHVSTFGGNHLSTAGARASLEYILANDLQGNASEVGGYLRGRLEEMSEKSPVVHEVRGRGLMLGLEIVDADLKPSPAVAARFMEACRERGVLVGKGGMKGNVIRISPPMTVTREAAATAAGVFEEALLEIRTPEGVALEG